MEDSLSDICAVVDFDGFHVCNQFYVREMGYCSLTKKYVLNQSYRFRLNHLSRRMTEKDWKTAYYCTRFVHGLSILCPPSEKEVFHIGNLNQLVLNVYRENRNGTQRLMAYKGGHVERDVFEDLDVPCVNLEDFGCPKYEKIAHLLSPERKDCGYHLGLKNPSAEAVHCPKLETRAFAKWVQLNR